MIRAHPGDAAAQVPTLKADTEAAIIAAKKIPALLAAGVLSEPHLHKLQAAVTARQTAADASLARLEASKADPQFLRIAAHTADVWRRLRLRVEAAQATAMADAA